MRAQLAPPAAPRRGRGGGGGEAGGAGWAGSGTREGALFHVCTAQHSSTPHPDQHIACRQEGAAGYSAVQRLHLWVAELDKCKAFAHAGRVLWHEDAACRTRAQVAQGKWCTWGGKGGGCQLAQQGGVPSAQQPKHTAEMAHKVCWGQQQRQQRQQQLLQGTLRLRAQLFRAPSRTVPIWP